MKLFLLALSAVCFGQSGLIDVATGHRCTAYLSPAISGREIYLSCTASGKPLLTNARVNMETLAGMTNGLSLAYIAQGDSITLLFKRFSALAPLHIEVTVNGAVVLNKDVPVP